MLCGDTVNKTYVVSPKQGQLDNFSDHWANKNAIVAKSHLLVCSPHSFLQWTAFHSCSSRCPSRLLVVCPCFLMLLKNAKLATITGWKCTEWGWESDRKNKALFTFLMFSSHINCCTCADRWFTALISLRCSCSHKIIPYLQLSPLTHCHNMTEWYDS